MYKARHARNRMQIFYVNICGRNEYVEKHFKQEAAIVKYNPIYAKISSWLSSLAVFTSLLTFLTLGKYKGTLASSDMSRVGKYMVLLTENDISITEFIPNSIESINFAVKNFD